MFHVKQHKNNLLKQPKFTIAVYAWAMIYSFCMNTDFFNENQLNPLHW